MVCTEKIYKNKTTVKLSYDNYVCGLSYYIEVIPSHTNKYYGQMFVYTAEKRIHQLFRLFSLI